MQLCSGASGGRALKLRKKVYGETSPIRTLK